jgi:hypothetical protein
MVLAKKPPSASAAVLDAHRAAMIPLKALVQASAPPDDFEMLGICQMTLDDRQGAS